MRFSEFTQAATPDQIAGIANGRNSRTTLADLKAALEGTPIDSRRRATRIVATKAHAGGNVDSTQGEGLLSDGVATGATYKLSHYATATANGVRALFGNCSYDLAGLNAIAVKAALQDAAGNIFPIYFNGARTITIEPGGLVESDVVGILLAKGDLIFSRTRVTVTSGDKWYKALVYHDGIGEGESASDVVDSGSVTSGLGYSFSPFEITGQVAETTPCVAIIGDSIARGVGSFPGYFDNSYIIQAFGANWGKEIGHSFLPITGEQARDFLNPSHRILRGRLLNGSTHAIVQYGVNDVRSGHTFIEVQADLLGVWNLLASMGLKVFQTTITPSTTSTDSWVTVQNQTIEDASNQAVRIAVNDWIRTAPAPLTGFFEVADVAESARNSGLWKAGHAADGIHPNPTGHASLAAGVDRTRFTF